MTPYSSHILSEFEPISIPPKTTLLKEGELANKLYLIKKGCLRLYFLDKSNVKEITFQFFFENDFVASFDSLYSRQPSIFTLESIEPTELFVVERDCFFKLINENPELRNIYEHKLVERFHVYQQLFLSRITKNPRQRYEELLADYPDIIKRVPQHYIASYLGITPVSLSRIRNRQK